MEFRVMLLVIRTGKSHFNCGDYHRVLDPWGTLIEAPRMPSFGNSTLGPLFLRRRVQPQESGRVVVQNVSLLLRGQVIGVLDDADGVRHQFGPEELIGAEHDAVFESGVDEALDVAVHFLDGIAPDESCDIDVDARVRL